MLKLTDLQFRNENGFNKMASRTLLQCCLLFSIIFTNKIEARTFNKTHDLERNQKYDIITTPVNKRSDDANDTERNDIEVMKKIYTDVVIRSYTNADSRRDMLSKKKYNRKCKHEHNDSDKSQEEQQSDDNLKSKTKFTSNEIKLTSLDNRKHYPNESTCRDDNSLANSINRKLDAQTIAIERVKKESVPKLEPNEESSLQNDVEKANHPTVKKVRPQKQLAVRHRNTKIRTTQATTEKQLIPKITHKRSSEVENEMCKTKHRDCKDHKSFEEISQKHDVYNSKHRDEFRTALKNDKKKKVNYNNMKIEHRDNKSHKTFKKKSQENSEYEFKYIDVEKPKITNTISMNNHNYERKHINDSATVEEPVSKHNNKKKVNKTNMKLQNRDNKIHKTFKKSSQENSEYKLKHRDIEKPIHVVSNTISMENDISVRKHIDDSAIVEEPVSKHNNKKKVNKNNMEIQQRDNKIHKTLKKSSQENSEYKIKHRDIEKPIHVVSNTITVEHDISVRKHIDDSATVEESVSKSNIKNKVKHQSKTSHRTFKTMSQEKRTNKKHRDIEKPNTISMENDVYVQKHINDLATVDKPDSDIYVEKHTGDSTAVEELSSKQVNPEYKPKFSHNFQKKRERDKKVRKVRHTNKTKHKSKTKHNSKEVITNQKKYKPTLYENSDSVSETHSDLRKGENEKNANSGHTLNSDDTPTLKNQDEKETQESYEKQLKQNDLQNKPRLPFYMSSTTKRVVIEIFKKQPKKLSLQDDEQVTNILLEDLNTVLKGKSDLRNRDIDLNTTMSRLASTKILDFITDRVAGQMLKKLEKSLASKNNLRMTDVEPKMVEQIDILLQKDGDIVMMGPEQIKEIKEDEYGIRETFYR